MNLIDLRPGDTATSPARILVVRALNDAFRQSFTGGRVILTAGVGALSDILRAAIIVAVRTFDDFDADDDPYGEHDFGALSVAGTRVFWKIDAYDRWLRLGSPDPADPAVTVRVLTIMLADEY